MERTIELLYNLKKEHYVVIYTTNNLCYCYKIDNINPIMLSRVFEIGYNPYQRERIVNEMQEFAQEEFKKLDIF